MKRLKSFMKTIFQNQGEMLKGSCQYIQENFQQTVALPLDENEIDKHIDVDIHVPFPEFDEDIYILNEKDKDEGVYSNSSLYHLISKTLFQNEESYQILNFEIACMETQNSELTLKEDLAFTCDSYELGFEGNSKN